jgi:hypothetical protein
LEEDGAAPSMMKHAASMRAAIAFFDRIGWLTPLRLREERQQG